MHTARVRIYLFVFTLFFECRGGRKVGSNNNNNKKKKFFLYLSTDNVMLSGSLLEGFICLIAYNRYTNIPGTYIHFVCIIARSIRIRLSLLLSLSPLSLFIYFSLSPSLVATSRFLVFLLACSVRFSRLFIHSIYPASESRERERERATTQTFLVLPPAIVSSIQHILRFSYIYNIEREREPR